MFETILLPLDGSELAEVALPCAQGFAVRLGSEVDLVTVCDMPGEQERLLTVYLNRMASQLTAKGVKVRSVVLFGKAADELLEYAHRNKIGLIIMATHGRSGLGRWTLGSVADRVLRATTLPLLLLRAGRCEEIAPEQPIFKRILLPLDGSRLGEGALPYVEEIAAKTKAEVHLLSVVQLPLTLTPGMAAFVEAGTWTRALEALREESQAYLERVGNALRTRGILAHTDVRVGSVGEAILSLAGSNNIDLIAMSTHGRSGISRWVLGSVAEKVLYGAEVPVFVVRAPGTP